MFAYCLNNPVNGADASGAVSLWYYLIIDSDYGFIHRTVQAHIVGLYGILLTQEVTLGSHGRADIVRTDTGEVWEVKHAANTPVERTAEAVSQAKKYIGGIHGDVEIISLGAAEAFSGQFYIKCGNYSYMVKYWTPQAGAILYSVKEVKEYNGEYYAVYVPKEERVNNPNKTSAIPAGLFLGFFLPGGAGGGLGFEYSCFDDSLAY